VRRRVGCRQKVDGHGRSVRVQGKQRAVIQGLEKREAMWWGESEAVGCYIQATRACAMSSDRRARA
jgi:hypothetical protein